MPKAGVSMSVAGRNALRRARRKRGEIVLPLVIEEVPIAEHLVVAGLMSEKDRDDRAKLAAAFETVVRTWVGVIA
jgi:hypothetical protein